MPTTTTPAAETVARTLADHPGGITARALADAAGIGASTASKALALLETAGTATRTPGPANGNRKTADIWHPATTAPADQLPTDAPPADETPTTDTSGDETPNDTAAEAPAPAGTTPRQPELKVLIMAGVLGDHPDGVSATDAIAESGLAPTTADAILAAMELAGAARRLPPGEDGTERWVRGDGDLTAVDPANAPTHVTCPTCGHTRRIRRPSAARRTSSTALEINADGSARLGKNSLRNQVEAFMRYLGPGHHLTPGTVAREMGGRSSGAVGNAMARLTGTGVLTMTSETPVKYALANNPPEPTPDVTACMPRPVITTPDEASDEARTA
jgi:hypothetical protein